MSAIVRLARLAPFVLAAACELQPAPKQQPAPPPPPPAAPVEAPKPVEARAADAGAGAPAPIAVTDQCVQIGVHVAGVLIAAATDPGQRSIYEQERAKMVRSTAEACTTQKWSAEASACYLAAKTPTALKDCEKKFAPPPPARPTTQPPPTPPTGPRPGMRPEPGAPTAPRAGTGSAAQPARPTTGSAAPARP